VAEDLAIYRKALGLETGPLSATIRTTSGTVRCQLFPAKSPIAVASFIGLASGKKPWRDTAGRIQNRPYYDDIAISRVIPGFVVATGPSNPGYPLANESSDLAHLPGTLAMESGADLVFVLEESKRLDGTETIIGRCVELPILRAISMSERDSQDRPTTPLRIESIRIGDEPVGIDLPPAKPHPAIKIR
jgi:peptidyl-prolyl cis-trans isomerase A (cyclophilin A)